MKKNHKKKHSITQTRKDSTPTTNEIIYCVLANGEQEDRFVVNDDNPLGMFIGALDSVGMDEVILYIVEFARELLRESPVELQQAFKDLYGITPYNEAEDE